MAIGIGFCAPKVVRKATRRSVRRESEQRAHCVHDQHLALSRKRDAALRQEARRRLDLGDGDAHGGEPMPFGPWGAWRRTVGKMRRA